jgi:hypothetical protein
MTNMKDGYEPVLSGYAMHFSTRLSEHTFVQVYHFSHPYCNRSPFLCFYSGCLLGASGPRSTRDGYSG